MQAHCTSHLGTHTSVMMLRGDRIPCRLKFDALFMHIYPHTVAVIRVSFEQSGNFARIALWEGELFLLEGQILRVYEFSGVTSALRHKSLPPDRSVRERPKTPRRSSERVRTTALDRLRTIRLPSPKKRSSDPTCEG